MTSQTSMLHVRIDDETKLQAQQALKAMGFLFRMLYAFF